MIYNGVDLRSVHPALSINQEIMPGSAPRNVTTVAGLDGERFVSVSLKQDEYKVVVNIGCHDRQQAREVRELLAAWACSSDKPAQLIPTYWPQRHYMGVCKEISPPEYKRGFATVTVSFALPSAIAVDNLLSTASGDTSCSIGLTGSAPARPILTLKLRAASAAVSLAVDGQERMRLIGPYAAGDTIKIDYAQRLVQHNGTNALTHIDYQRSRWRGCFPHGRHTIAADVACDMRVEWRDEWL